MHHAPLQERDPQAYQLYLRAPNGATFFGSTPERLYVRTGSTIASEAVAATRPRGPPGIMFLPLDSVPALPLKFSADVIAHV